ATADARIAAVDAIVRDGRIRYPDALPITARRDELVQTIREHQVVVVAGETGSGKSTQLPKLCIEAGRGAAGMIGHTQPRRVAARTIADRVAEELGCELGREVGYTVRFTDRVADETVVRVMTDGILLAELQRDRLLRRYDTLIIDEAHERSLNIDFILGYLEQLLPKRPDLKVIVTSATIDTARFARHFARDGVDAPVVEVSGRTYPVEVRYRPYGVEPDDDRDQVQAIVDAVDELSREGLGDVLVFVSGEREIRDAADALRRIVPPDTEVLPLYARLSSAEQHRVFEPHRGRRIVLSTNVAETSITVPGVRYVVDAGNARISRYSRRLKVQQLPIEPISRASADQRAGRCGRVAPGICIRLYGEEDYAERPEFTEPEILRTNLAAVILQMTAIGLGDVASFPFVEAPDAASIRDGYRLLEELDAITAPRDGGQRKLTPIGRRLARLPLDPRLGRMVLEAERHNCVREVLIIASALSIQDPRERPHDNRQQADELHRRFDVPGSDLLSFVELWEYVREQQRALSSNQFRKLCRAEHLNYLRVREWQDLYSQLRRVVGDIGIRVGTGTAHPDDVHRAVLAGLLSHVGMRERDGRTFRGARGARFVIARDSVLANKPPRWVMAADLVETNQLWARRVATIKPEWAEQAGAHLVKRSYGDPYWDEKRGVAMTTETVTLFGLPIVTGRLVPYHRVDPEDARAMFIEHALVEGRWRTHHRFVERNRAFRERVRELEARVRRVDLLDEDALVQFFDARVGKDVVSARHFDRWWKRESARRPDLLDLTDDVLRIDDDAVRPGDYPDVWRDGDLELPLSYRFDPGDPLDGAAVHVPVVALNQLDADALDWNIPGYRAELVESLVRTLPKQLRRELAPLSETVRAAHDRLGEPKSRLVDRLAEVLAEVAGLHIPPDAFDLERVPPHLRMNIVVEDDTGAVLGVGRDLRALQRELGGVARAAVAAAAPIRERRGITTWDVGTLPRCVEVDRGGVVVRGYPALLDDGDSVSLRVFTTPEVQQRAMRGGVRRLLVLTAAPSHRDVARVLDNADRLAIARAGMSPDELVDDCIAATVERVLADHGDLPWDEDAFAALQHEVRRVAPQLARDALRTAADVLATASTVRAQLDRLTAAAVKRSA
ncbi:MAG TPA: ATP-dependent RNA helicase HrpA, partial [Acidimicrobiales bacterium]